MKTQLLSLLLLLIFLKGSSQSITSFFPSSGSKGEFIQVTVSGHNFMVNPPIGPVEALIYSTSSQHTFRVYVQNDSQLVGDVLIPADFVSGIYNVSFTNLNWALSPLILTNYFEVNNQTIDYRPTLLSPFEGEQLNSNTIQINWEGVSMPFMGYPTMERIEIRKELGGWVSYETGSDFQFEADLDAGNYQVFITRSFITYPNSLHINSDTLNFTVLPQVNLGISSFTPNTGSLGDFMTVQITGVNLPLEGNSETGAMSKLKQGNFEIEVTTTSDDINQLNGEFIIPINSPLGFYDYYYFSNYYNDTFVLANAFYITPSNLVSGKVYFDSNDNGIYEVGIDVPIPIATIGGNNRFVFTDSYGNYIINFGEGNVSISPQNTNGYTYSPISYDFSFTEPSSNNPNQDFRISNLDTIHNLSIYLSSLGPARPNLITNYYIRIENLGITSQSPNVTITNLTPELCTFTYATTIPTSISDNVFTWQFDELAPFQVFEALVSFQITGALNDSIFLNYEVEGQNEDDFPDNDIGIFGQKISNSYDPNIKEVTPATLDTGFVSRGDFLTYTIHFQNTGNDTAFIVKVFDTLSNYLDIGTFDILGSSHTCQPVFYENGLVVFEFPNIMLPDSFVNETASHGFVTYRIKPKSTFMLGDVITNTAHIYFDFNEAIVTNTTESEMVLPISIGRIEDKITSFPNPVKDHLTLNLSGNLLDYNFTILNTLGQPQSGFQVVKYEANKIQLNMENLNTGIYIIKILNGKKILLKKVVKE